MVRDRNPRRSRVHLTLVALLLAALLAGCAKAQPATAPATDSAGAGSGTGEVGTENGTDGPAEPAEPTEPPAETETEETAEQFRPGSGDRAAGQEAEPGAKRPGEGAEGSATSGAEPAEPELPGALAVMIENSWNARPQAGLEKADLVYEMEAEGGITRFLALFHTRRPNRLGPVRSARMGFYDVAVAYGVPYAHAGGSADVREELRYRNTRLLDLDGIYTCGRCFWRIQERRMPHNLYTDAETLIARAREVGWELKPLYRFPRGEAPAGGQAAAAIAFDWGQGSQDVTWTWDGQRYLRSQSGGPHVAETGEQISARNVILLFTRYVWDPNTNDGKGQHHVSIVGSGSGYLFRDGRVWPIRWSKPSREEHYTFTTPDGDPALLAPGRTWVEILKGEVYVTAGIPR